MLIATDVQKKHGRPSDLTRVHRAVVHSISAVPIAEKGEKKENFFATPGPWLAEIASLRELRCWKSYQFLA